MWMKKLAKQLGLEIGGIFISVEKHENSINSLLGIQTEVLVYREGVIKDITNNLIIVDFEIPKRNDSNRTSITECFNIGDIVSNISIIEGDSTITNPPVLGSFKEEETNIFGSLEYPVFAK